MEGGKQWLLLVYAVFFCFQFTFSSAGNFTMSNFNVSGVVQVVGSAYFVTCTDEEAARLPGANNVVNKDSTLISQETTYDYVRPRHMTTVNATRSIFEETVRRKNELYQFMAAQDKKLADLEEQLTRGLESDSSGQVWLISRLSRDDLAAAKANYAEIVQFDKDLFTNRTEEYLALYPYNDHQPFDPSTCRAKIRLTPPAGHTVGAAWFVQKLNIFGGFTVDFTFQVSGRNRVCTDVVESRTEQQKGPALTLLTGMCIESGSDGFAFVIQGQGLDALGTAGSGLGYNSIPNSLAIEFDMFANIDIGDLNAMHVEVHAADGGGPNDASKEGRIGSFGALRTTSANTTRDLQDGKVHAARVTFVPRLEFSPFIQPQWKAARNLKKFLKANLGTMRVFVDDMKIAVINIPIDLTAALGAASTSDSVWIGFTAATGSQWQQHDILSFAFRDTVDE